MSKQAGQNIGFKVILKSKHAKHSCTKHPEASGNQTVEVVRLASGGREQLRTVEHVPVPKIMNDMLPLCATVGVDGRKRL